jgi:hypothetical protein
LPLLHRRETKLVVALKGGVDIRAGRRRIALLEEDEAIELDSGIAHRIHQYGPVPGTVGAVLLPGAIEQEWTSEAGL